MELHKAIKNIVETEGQEIVKDVRLINILSDFRAFDAIPASKYILRAVIVDGYAQKLLAIGSWNTQSENLCSQFVAMTGFQNDYVSIVFQSLAYGLGWKTGVDIVIVPEIKSTFSCGISNLSFSQMTKEQKEQYLESLVERDVTQEKALGIESVQVSVDIRSDEDIYYYIEIEGVIKNDICLDVIVYGDNRKIFDKNTEWIPDYVFGGSQAFWMQLKGVNIDRIRKIKVTVRNAIRLH
jgi:hypothetical protein